MTCAFSQVEFESRQQIAVLPNCRLCAVEIHVSSNLKDIPAIDLEPRAEGKQRHG
jgi:hypothetical protein